MKYVLYTQEEGYGWIPILRGRYKAVRKMQHKLRKIRPGVIVPAAENVRWKYVGKTVRPFKRVWYNEVEMKAKRV